MDGLVHSWPHLMWTPETQGRGLLCCSHQWCSCTWPVSGPVFVKQRWLLLPLSQGWWAADDYYLVFSAAVSLHVDRELWALACFCQSSLISFLKSPLLDFPSSLNTGIHDISQWALALHWHLPKGLQRGVHPRARLGLLCWISHVICACHTLLLMVNEWLCRML